MKMFIGTKALSVLLMCITFCSVQAEDLPRPDGKEADMTKPVQVYILMGQSNMLGFGKIASLKGIAAEKYPYLVDDTGAWTVRKDVRNVRLMCSGSGSANTHLNEWLTVEKGIGKSKQIGPEIGIGYHLGEAIDAPVLILKVCIGNRSLGYDLLPPSAPGYEGEKDKQPRSPSPNGRKWYAGVQYDGDVNAALNALKDIGKYYPGATKYEVAGFLFWQGAKDSGDGALKDAYEKNLVTFIKDLRKDFNAPEALFTVATMGQAKKGDKITDAQLVVDGENGKYPEFKGNVASFYSHPVSKGGGANGHYSGNPETYMNIGEGMGAAMAKLVKDNSKSQKSDNRSGASIVSAIQLTTDQKGKLSGLIKSTLIEMSEKGELKPVQVNISKTRAKIWLAKADSEGLLTFQIMNGQKQAAFKFEDLKGTDHIILSRLIAAIRTESKEAQALAGLCIDSIGNKRLAANYFKKSDQAALVSIVDLLK